MQKIKFWFLSLLGDCLLKQSVDCISVKFFFAMMSLSARLVFIVEMLESGRVQESVDCIKRLIKILPEPNTTALKIAKEWAKK